MYIWEYIGLNFLNKFNKEIWPKVNFEFIQNKSKILVIDDEGFPYKELFEKEHYTVIVWDNIKDLGELERDKYDVILLDIEGIGCDYSSSAQGLGILEHIKKRNPMQMVIAITNKTWDIDAQKFFSLADERLNKTEDFIVYKQKVDDLLNKRYSKDYYLEKLNSILKQQGYNERQIKSYFEKTLVQKQPTAFISKVKSGLDSNCLGTITNILNIAISVLTVIISNHSS